MFFRLANSPDNSLRNGSISQEDKEEIDYFIKIEKSPYLVLKYHPAIVLNSKLMTAFEIDKYLQENPAIIGTECQAAGRYLVTNLRKLAQLPKVAEYLKGNPDIVKKLKELKLA